MLSARRHTYDLNVKLNTVAEAKAVNDNREIAREYGISESWWEKAQPATFSVSWWAADDNKLYIHPKGPRWI